ncbi:LOW QUALITY PROTEIN: protein ALP1-like protein [Cinnamomum micranthum f. kanehirae]|uniref:Protein ALP1-like protein n=1 Tax=Cinnamomum micranthum f. kanehirae TaxID=337451 RepID=A0A443PAY8_9MAGN|nr:LOW QUALITY PROTEIN: protein ALP1-like protein [Cinnamomum micranthum f. kanehirae]
MLRPTSGSFLGPKRRAATPAMTTSSGTPSPNKQRQSRPVCDLFLVKTIVLLFFNRNSFLPLLKKRDLQEDKEALWGVLGRVGPKHKVQTVRSLWKAEHGHKSSAGMISSFKVFPCIEVDIRGTFVSSLIHLFRLHFQTAPAILYGISEPGYEFVNKVLCGHEERCFDLFRMENHVFHGLCNALKTKNLLHDSKFLSVEEQVAIFLMTISQNVLEQNDRFQHSGETISHHFKRVLKVIELIILPAFTDTPLEIINNPKYYPWFKGPLMYTREYINSYKGSNSLSRQKVTQNVMCACSFDIPFTFVYAGWIGTTNDFRVFVEAITNLELHFLHPPTGKSHLMTIYTCMSFVFMK